MRKPRIASVMPIAELLWPDFAVVKGCVFLKKFAPPSENIRFPSRTEFDENHVHLLDYFTHGATVRSEPFFDPHHPDFIAAKTSDADRTSIAKKNIGSVMEALASGPE